MLEYLLTLRARVLHLMEVLYFMTDFLIIFVIIVLLMMIKNLVGCKKRVLILEELRVLLLYIKMVTNHLIQIFELLGGSRLEFKKPMVIKSHRLA